MMLVTLLTYLGPVLGVYGWQSTNSWCFWIGVLICFVSLNQHMASGVLRSPFIAVIFMIAGAFFGRTWYFGVGLGLTMWACLFAAGDLYGRIATLAGRIKSD